MKVLSVRVIPQSTRPGVEETQPDHFTVHLTASAIKGKANKTMLVLLAQHLGVPVSDLILSRGDRSNEKTVILLNE